MTKYNIYISGTSYDLAQLYNINTSTTNYTLSSFYNYYNNQIYDINSFLKPNSIVTNTYVIGSEFTKANINTSGYSLYYISSILGTTINNPVTTTITINSTTTVKMLLIGGGGCGGNNTTNSGNGGGQGGSGVYTDITLIPGIYTITIDSGTNANTTYGRGGSNITFSSSNNTFTFIAMGGSGGQNTHAPGYSSETSNGLKSPTTSLSGSNSYYYSIGSNGQSAGSFSQGGYCIVPNNLSDSTISTFYISKNSNRWYYPSGYSLGQTSSYVNYTNYYNIIYNLLQLNYYYLPIDINMYNDIISNFNTYKTFFQLGFGSGGGDGSNYPGYSYTDGFVYAGGGGRGPGPSPTNSKSFKAINSQCYSIGCGGFGENSPTQTVSGPEGGPAIMYLYIPTDVPYVPYVPPVYVAPTALFSSLTTSSSSRCNGCFSLKLCISTYIGYILTIRRADNVYKSFYSNPNGDITTILGGSGTTITDFLLGTTGYIETWYDQSGKGNHATQTNTNYQPLFDVTNKCIDFGYSNYTYLYLKIPSGTVPVGILDASYSFVVKHGYSRNSSNGGFIGAGIGNYNNCNSFRFQNGINRYWNYWWNNDFGWGDVSTISPIVASVSYNGTTKTRKGYVSNILKNSASATGTNTSSAIQSIGVTVANEYLQGQIYSLLIFSVELPQEDINILNLNSL